MDYSVDHVRRELRESQVEHVAALRTMRDIVGRLFSSSSNVAAESQSAKADFVTGGLNRRSFLRIGGVTVATAAVFAACGGDEDATTAGEDEGEAKKASPADITILRTASSIEAVAFDVYQTAIDSGLVTTPAVVAAAKLFQEQHKEHGDLFKGATRERGGEPFATANPVLMQQLQPAIAALRDEAGVVRLAYDVENVATSTYYTTAGAFEDATLNVTTMSIGGVEARHAAVLAAVIGQPPAPGAFRTAAGAVTAGTGV